VSVLITTELGRGLHLAEVVSKQYFYPVGIDINRTTGVSSTIECTY